MHIPSLVEIHWCLLKLSSGNEKRMDGRTVHIPSLVKIHWCLLKLSSGNKKRMDGRTTDGRTDGLTDNQRETIIPRHYCVAGYKNVTFFLISPYSGYSLQGNSNEQKTFLLLLLFSERYNNKIYLYLLLGRFMNVLLHTVILLKETDTQPLTKIDIRSLIHSAKLVKV